MLSPLLIPLSLILSVYILCPLYFLTHIPEMEIWIDCEYKRKFDSTVWARSLQFLLIGLGIFSLLCLLGNAIISMGD